MKPIFQKQVTTKLNFSVNLLHLIKWDLVLQVRYHIFTAAAVVSALYYFIFLNLHFEGVNKFMLFIIFSDPSVLGFLFTGVIILFEKNSNTLEAMSVTPVKISEYLWSKAISLTIIALLAGLAITISVKGFEFNFLFLIPAILLTSILFIFLGFIGVARVNTFNQYIIVIPLFLAPAILPLLNFFQLAPSYIWYIIPTQASLLLFQGSIENISMIEIIYSYSYLILSIYFAYRRALFSYKKHILKGGNKK